jgi:hypothetical protein
MGLKTESQKTTFLKPEQNALNPEFLIFDCDQQQK